MARQIVLRGAVFSLLLAIGTAACSSGGSSTLPGSGTLTPAEPSLGPTSASAGRAILASGHSLGSDTGEQAQSSDAFTDSIGVNTHMSWGVYNANLPAVASAVRDLGIRHIREGFELKPNPQYLSTLQSLGNSGVRAVLCTHQADDPNAIARFVGTYVPTIEAFEGPNEPNPQYGEWASELRTFVTNLYTAVKSDNTASQYPVYAPALHDWPGQDPWAALGDVSAYVDYSNVHDYTGGYIATDHSIDLDFDKMREISGSKTPVATENGFSTSTANNGLPATIDMSYTVRMLFKQFQRGFVRTWLYELLDEATDPGDYWHQTGLMTYNLQPKPVYFAVKNLISLLSDRGSVAPKTKLAYSIGGDTTNLMHVLLQKNDGTYYLAVWLNVSDFDVASHTVLNPAAQQVSLSFGDPIASVSDYHLDDAGNLSADPVNVNAGQAAFNATDRVQIFKIVPGTGAAPSPVAGAPVLPHTAAHWAFNEGSGSTAADSVSGARAVFNGNAYWTPGLYGPAVALPDGSHLSAAGASMDTAQSYSVAAWLRLTDTTQTRAAVSVEGYQHSAFRLGFVPGRGFAFQVYAADTSSEASVRASQDLVKPDPNTWYHVVGVLDKANCRILLYVNGSLAKTAGGCSAFRAIEATDFGRDRLAVHDFPNSWSGAIDEVNLYQRALSQEEVATLAHRP